MSALVRQRYPCPTAFGTRTTRLRACACFLKAAMFSISRNAEIRTAFRCFSDSSVVMHAASRHNPCVVICCIPYSVPTSHEGEPDTHAEAGRFILRKDSNVGCPGRRAAFSQSRTRSRTFRQALDPSAADGLRVRTPNLDAHALISFLRIPWKSGTVKSAELLGLFFEPFMMSRNAVSENKR